MSFATPQPEKGFEWTSGRYRRRSIRAVCIAVRVGADAGCGRGLGRVAVELGLAATGYASVIAELTGAPWVGAASLSMVAAATPYVAWLSQAAARAEQAGMQAAAAAAAYEAAFVMTVPPPVITANRVLVMTLIATNFSVRTRRRSRSLRRSTPKCGRKTPLLCMAMRLRRRARRG